MNFLNPLFLIGLAAAAIPIALHLLNLRKLKTVEFSTLRFLKELQKTKIRRLKLKQIILLILRTLIIIFAVLAFARPAIRGTLPFMESYARTSSVIIIDNSFSMDVSDEFGNRLNQSRNSANRILSAMKDGDETAIIEAASPPNPTQFSLSTNFAHLKEQISNVKISYRRADLENALRRAVNILSESKNLNKEIFIITDAQSNVFHSEMKDTAQLFNENISIFTIPVGASSRADIQNLSIDTLNVITKIFQSGKPVEIEARIRNNSKRTANNIVASLLFDGERSAQRSVSIPAGEVRQVTLSAIPKKAGATAGWVEIEGDALESDNSRYFGFILPEKPELAIIGNPASVSFLSLALKAAGGGESSARIKTFGVPDFPGMDLSQFDILLISGGPLTHTDFQRIAEFVNTGGSVMLFADEQTPSKTLSEGLATLGFNSSIAQAFPENQYARFTTVDRHHPLFDGVFKGTTESKEIVESPNIYKAAPAEGGFVIVEMPGGAFLAESKLGEGKIIYCAVPANTSWSNFPMTGIFPAVVFRGTAYLAANESAGAELMPGEPFMLALPKKQGGESNMKLIDPAGNETFHQPVKLPSGTFLSFEGFNQLGSYRIENSKGRQFSIISVNPSPSESNLAPIKEADMAKWLEVRFPNAFVEFISPSDNLSKGLTRARTGTELWQLFILLAIFTAIAEMIVARVGKNSIEAQS